jgi:hypothetical protein
MILRLVVALALAAPLVALAACESTQDKSARLAKLAKRQVAARGLSVVQVNPDVRVLGSSVLHDANGTAVALELKNTGSRDLVDLPIAIDVKDAQGKSLYRNDAPGLDASLVGLPVLRGGQTVWWVDDQVLASGRPASVGVKVGRSKAGTSPTGLPKIQLSGVHPLQDTEGASIVGTIENRSKIVQRRLTVFVVARKGGRVVAAGRAIIDKLDPAPTKKPIHFKSFFIGNPRGARYELTAPPTVLQKGAA